MKDSQQRKNLIIDAIDALQFKNEPVFLAGSAGEIKQEFYGDFDLLIPFTTPYKKNEYYEEFKNIMDRLANNNDIYFIELKIQLKDQRKYKIYKASDFTYQFFEKHFSIDKIDFLKIDIIVQTIKGLFECSAIYNIHDKHLSDDEIKDIFTAEFYEKYNDGDYFKALKRLYSLWKAKDTNKEGQKKVLDFFNSATGELYQFNSQLKALLSLPKDAQAMKAVNDFLQSNGIKSYNENAINRMINKNDEKINKDALDFMQKSL